MLIAPSLVELAKKEQGVNSMREFLQDKNISNIQSSDPSWVTDIDTPQAFEALSRFRKD
jgi:hypothetical protein